MAIPFDPRTGLPKAPAPISDVLSSTPRFRSPTVGVPKTRVGDGGDSGDGFGGTDIGVPPGSPYASGITPHPPLSGPSIADLQGLINNDPLYKQTAADIAASRIASQAQLTAARQRALTLYGEVPDFSQASSSLVGNVAPDITDTVRQLAKQNSDAGLSTTSRLRQSYDDNIKALQDSLTARGLLSSGENGYQLGRQNTQYQQAKYDATQQLLDLLASYQNSYLSGDASLRQQLAAAAQAAAGRIPADTTSAPTTPPPPSDNSGVTPPPASTLPAWLKAALDLEGRGLTPRPSVGQMIPV